MYVVVYMNFQRNSLNPQRNCIRGAVAEILRTETIRKNVSDNQKLSSR